jgi:hypothetical protein
VSKGFLAATQGRALLNGLLEPSLTVGLLPGLPLPPCSQFARLFSNGPLFYRSFDTTARQRAPVALHSPILGQTARFVETNHLGAANLTHRMFSSARVYWSYPFPATEYFLTLSGARLAKAQSYGECLPVLPTTFSSL